MLSHKILLTGIATGADALAPASAAWCDVVVAAAAAALDVVAAAVSGAGDLCLRMGSVSLGSEATARFPKQSEHTFPIARIFITAQIKDKS